jgi:hypothetical protein
MRYRGIPGDRAREGQGGWEPFTADINLSNGWHRRDLSGHPLFERAGGRRGPSVGAPIRPAVRLCAVGPSIPGHDVSGTGWHVMGCRAMQSITTMVPVWQRGHSRNDRPVSASKRSR